MACIDINKKKKKKKCKRGGAKNRVKLETSHDNIKLLESVQFVPNLWYNLLSVDVLFDDNICIITNKKFR